MGIIRVLDDHVANQIAAGEVIERPASVVKELVENAIDAGSTRIDVTIEEGGLELIRVADNGSGMEPDDCELAFSRHATSKIAGGKDLFQIRTLGFRGEALPSIAAVAKVECTTAHDTSGLGRKLMIEGGSVKGLEEIAASRGTTFEVKHLFFNTPARLKYMKTIQTELGHISDYMYRLAMAHPSIAFSLRHNGGELLRTLGNGDPLQVIAAVYGTTTAKAMLRVQGEHPDYGIVGYVSKPELNRANRQAISFFLNGRYIRNFALSHALMNAYHTLLPINRYPVAAISLRMDPELVDVNVHPSKLEVRFSKEQELVQFLERHVRDVLQGHVHIPSGLSSAAQRNPIRELVVQEQMELYRPQSGGSAPAPAAASESAPQAADSAEPDWTLLQASAPPAPTAAALETAAAVEAPAAPRPAAPPLRAQQAPSYAPPPELPYAKLTSMLAAPETAAPAVPAFPKLDPIGQLHGTYIVAQNERGLYLVDQHAAHERVNYEYYFEKFGQPDQASQELLLPITLEFTSAEAEALADKLPLLEQVGVYLETFGGSSFLVRSLPHWFPQGEEKALLDEMADWVLIEKKSVNLTKLREKAAIMCSCKASIKANQSMSTVEIEALLDRLAACRNPYTCPHGRPIVVSFSTYELEKMFKRVM
ncbi:DNA mismatch repair endonuclease MutL [Paenibacillus koleovorans]|uniref:DNA mismatch repair endonuclease MutL n=1 Tax=Paenibacillus koleovorans TaxID=121608 RepID=UPI000FD70F88|nr:DNA mismatch repair endonuclease MutL [Paenibacillus koleovorans]